MRQRPTIRRARSGFTRRGFTLLEVAIAIVVLAVGIVAVQGLVGATTASTAVTNELQTSTMLASAMHERCLGLDRTALLSLNNTNYAPPRDSQAAVLSGLPDYSQKITVNYVSPRSLSASSATATDLLRVSVTVSRLGQPVLTTSRLIATTKQD